MTGVADQQDLAPALVVDLGFAVNFGDERAGGVEREEVALSRVRRHRLRHAVRGKDHRRGGLGNFAELLDEYGALGLEAFHDVTVVHDLVPHIDRRAVADERLLDGVDGTHHPGAKAAWRAQQHFERRLCYRFGFCARVAVGIRFGHGATDMALPVASVKRALACGSGTTSARPARAGPSFWMPA